eukprot:TRINITY_DN1912_c0_g1_i1.p1 TRINITY_DN1912_c0_g1~~TRINITY_DN1912_c0_g1_i1.p1  ORF type:complete len:346 (-),score=85.37 TRINITY_DN1912_c0_g1_i1:135-1172(-)
MQGASDFGGGLQSIALIEKDTNSDVIVSWSFPSSTATLDVVLKDRSFLTREVVELQTSFSRFGQHWHHFHVETVQSNEKLPRVTAFAVVLLSKSYDPEKYFALAKMLAAVYQNTGDTKKLLELYLKAYTTGVADGGALGKFAFADHDPRKALFGGSIKALVSVLNVESILLWVGMMLKKRIVVFADRLDQLLPLVRAFPLLVWHRQNWDLLRPYVSINELQLQDLQTAGAYVAGFTDSRIKNYTDFYDVYVDIPAQSVTVAEHAKTDFVLGSFHKDLAATLISAASDQTDQAIVKILAQKTRELLTNLQALGGGESITKEVLQQKKLGAAMERFLFNVASQESLA